MVIHTVKGFVIVKKAEVDAFLELSLFFYDIYENIYDIFYDFFFPLAI